MPFQNLEIDIDSIPRASELDLKPIDGRYLRVLLLNWIIGWLAILIAVVLLLVFSERFKESWILLAAAGGWLLFVAISWALTSLSFRYKAFAVRERDIIYRTGWLIQSVRVCPFNRIQHCSVDSGVFERRYGLSSLSVYTAGGMQADMKLPGLPQELAASLRELILSKTNAGRGE